MLANGAEEVKNKKGLALPLSYGFWEEGLDGAWRYPRTLLEASKGPCFANVFLKARRQEDWWSQRESNPCGVV
jgi:hypothetical protein